MLLLLGWWGPGKERAVSLVRGQGEVKLRGWGPISGDLNSSLFTFVEYNVTLAVLVCAFVDLT